MQKQPKAKRPAARAKKPDRRCATKKPRAGKTSGPQTAQQTLPYREMYKDGICRVDGRLYTKSMEYEDINYQLAQADDQSAIFDGYCAFLNSFDSSLPVQLSFINHRSRPGSKYRVNIPRKTDSYSGMRDEYVEMLEGQIAKSNNGIVRTKLITFGVTADSPAVAKPRLERVEADIAGNFKKLGVQSRPLTGLERLEILHGQLHPGGTEPFSFTWNQIPATGLSTKDFIAPSSFDFRMSRLFRMGATWGAASYMQIMASELSDKLLAELLEVDAEMTITMHIQTVDQAKAIKTIKGKVSDIDKMKVEEQKKAVRSGYDMDILPPVLCYQIRQSFLPGEITLEDANRIGYELAMRWTKGKHQFIVTTHTDKAHIHNHIYYNSTTLDCTHKYRDFLGSGRALRRLSDTLCLENGLSIVQEPKLKSQGKYKHYGEWVKGRERPLTFQQKLCAAIDTALEKQPASLADFLSLMEQSGYEVKQQRGVISFRAPGQERFTRLRSSTLGKGYGQKDIEAALSGSGRNAEQPRQRVNLVINIQSRLQGKGPGYERWAKVFNLKQMAVALAYLQENNLMEYEQLEKKASETVERFHTLSDQIKNTEADLRINMELKAATVQYAKTRPVFQEYKARKYSRKFLAEHEAEIDVYRAACADFKRILGGAKLPKMDELKEEGRKLAEKKKKLYAEYRKAKADMQEVTTIKANIDYLLGYTEPGRRKEQER